MLNIERVEELLRQAKANRHTIIIRGSQEEAAIVAIENQLGVRFPPDFGEFIARYSAMVSNDLLVEGRGVNFLTQTARQEKRLPKSFLVTSDDVDGNGYYCLDRRTFPSTPVFWRDSFDENTSSGKLCACSFEEFLLRTWTK